MTRARTDHADRAMLDLAARVALRAAGDVEPNPLVGCVIGRIDRGRPVVLGVGHHRRFGGPHAEVEALESCRRSDADPRGATAWVTLEPCAHTGKTGPCTRALIDAGVRRVVYAREDPHPLARGGAAALHAAGVEVELSGASPDATRLADPFVRRVSAGLPWVIAKWAQTLDGRVATRSGESKWISCRRSLATTHRVRARVDAIIIGVGTAVADDPMLTARGVRRVRRLAARVVLDPSLRTPPEGALARTAREAPLVLACDQALAAGRDPRAERWRGLGAEVWGLGRVASGLDVRELLRRLASERDATNVVVEGGPTTLGAFLEADAIDEARVFVAPLALGDDDALPAIRGRIAHALADGRRFELVAARRSGADALLCLRRALSPSRPSA